MISCAHAEDWSQTRLAWESEPIFETPEAVLYDAEREVLYVTNFRVTDGDPAERNEFLSLLAPSGEIVSLKWIVDLKRPTGMTIHRGSLFVVERDHLVEIDRERASIVQRVPLDGPDFPNDIVFDDNGVGYISDNGQNATHSIYKLIDGEVSPWISVDVLTGPNGLLMDGSHLIAYDRGNQALIRIDCGSARIEQIAKLESDSAAVGDGLVLLDNQHYLVTAWGGPSWVVHKDGRILPLLDTSTMTPAAGNQVNSADAGYIPSKKLWIIPTFFDRRLLAYEFHD